MRDVIRVGLFIVLFLEGIICYLEHRMSSFESTRGIVYMIKCKDCDCVYIGQTSRALKSRVKEHAKAIATLDKNSLLAKHHMLHSHQIDFTRVEIVDRSSAWRQRLILEAWHSVRNTNAINEHIALSNVYNNICRNNEECSRDFCFTLKYSFEVRFNISTYRVPSGRR